MLVLSAGVYLEDILAALCVAQNTRLVVFYRNTHCSLLFIAESLTAGVILINQSGTIGADFLRITGRSLCFVCVALKKVCGIYKKYTRATLFIAGDLNTAGAFMQMLAESSFLFHTHNCWRIPFLSDKRNTGR